ncbi:MAG: HPr family phosphocarrier protein [Butyrivibrio sp.]|nr:HPr family phosphocarrier protein [Butyrivibrio sp.]
MLGINKKSIMLSPDQVKDFVNAATKCDFDIDIYYNRYVVDAKSILGVFGLDLTQTLTVEYRGYNSDFENYLKTLAIAS